MVGRGYINRGSVFVVAGKAPPGAKPMSLPKECLTSPPSLREVWIPTHVKLGFVMSEAFKDEATALEQLEANGVSPDEFVPRKHAVTHPFHAKMIFSGRFTCDTEPVLEGGVFTWNSVTLTTPSYDIPADTGVAMAQFDTANGTLYFLTDSGFVLASEKLA